MAPKKTKKGPKSGGSKKLAGAKKGTHGNGQKPLSGKGKKTLTN